ncbi:acetyltransferase domain-containing protein [Astrocystis sublimbata]|nr:acetyltransferase domain-containing protein [Astrocystis sublimbata]
MRVNENTAVSTSKIVLVPYDARHVERYHAWMQNESLREATASDLLDLDEEYENQQSWRVAHDKLTFIICRSHDGTWRRHADTGGQVIRAGEDDAPERMVGDVNLFLTALDDGDDENEHVRGDGNGVGEQGGNGAKVEKDQPHYVQGEIDIMIAVPEDRGKGLGEAAVRAFLRYLSRNREDIMKEYMRVEGTKTAKIKRLIAKIHAHNKGSIRLFGNLGFMRVGEPDYFNEISMAVEFGPHLEHHTGGSDSGHDSLEYSECLFDRSRLDNRAESG